MAASGPPQGGVAGPGSSPTVPPASVPLSFLAAAGVGLFAFGLAAWFAADNAVVAPTVRGVVSAVHMGVLAFLTVAVLGAVHQFAPVVGRRPLRSVPAARLTWVCIVAAAWMLPLGFAHGPESLVAAGAVSGTIGVAIALWNLSGPLAGDGGVPIAGLRASLVLLAVTVTFGLVYAFDRQAGWFPLLGHRVLAHAHLGLLGWLGVTYIAVAEKLWPMFLLSHRPSARSGAWAVGLLSSGTVVLATGLLFGMPLVAWPGAMLAVAGLGAHLWSLVSTVRHRRRPLELLHAFLFASAGFLVVGVLLAAVASLSGIDSQLRARLVGAEVLALMAWTGLAVIGHAHKIVPFIGYSALRARGVTQGPGGRPLLFGDLFHGGAARATFVLAVTGFGLGVLGMVAGSSTALALGGVAVALTGVVVTSNLALGPLRAARTAGVKEPPVESPDKAIRKAHP